jgi:hypothetical protein
LVIELQVGPASRTDPRLVGCARHDAQALEAVRGRDRPLELGDDDERER